MKLNVNKTIFVNGNALEMLDNLVAKNVVVDMIFTDPPYKVTSYGNSGSSGGMLTKKSTMAEKIFEHNDIEIEEYLPKFYKVLKETGHCYIMTNHKNLTHFLKVIDEWKDENGKQTEGLLDLIRAVHGVEGIKRIRLGSLEPRIVTEEFAKELAFLPQYTAFEPLAKDR